MKHRAHISYGDHRLLSTRHSKEAATSRRIRRKVEREIPPWQETLTEPRRQLLLAELVLRDGPRCYLCKQMPLPHQYEIDHVIPRAHGGTDETTNLAITCGPCNRRKRDYIVAFTINERIPDLRLAT